MARLSASLLGLLATCLGLCLQPICSVREWSGDAAGQNQGLDTEEALGASASGTDTDTDAGTDADTDTDTDAGRPAAATCAGSGFFVDWGSSGMKVFPVHAAGLGEPEEMDPTSTGDFKIKNKKAQSSKAELLEALEELRKLLPPAQVQSGTNTKGNAKSEGEGEAAGRFAMLATAGHRLEPEQAKHAWSVIKEWSSQNPGVLGRCSEEDDEDCQTIPGSQEAAWELEAALAEAKTEGVEVGENFAFASAGGASLQVGFRGNQSDMHQCLADLGGLDDKYDKQRAAIKVVGGKETLVLSFLSIAGMEKEERGCRDMEHKRDLFERVCDYMAGGLDQARATFSNWLRDLRKAPTNPCLSEHTELKDHGSLCQQLFKTDKCVVDKYGGGISGLPPSTHATILQAKGLGDQRARSCQNYIRMFLDEDLMVSLWQKSVACWNLAEQAKKVLLMTAFARATQFGVHTEDWVSLKSATEQAFKLDWVDAAQAAEGEEGLLMTSVMLHTFLDMLQIPPKALLKGFGGSWTEQAMKERALKKGWAKAGSSCPA